MKITFAYGKKASQMWHLVGFTPRGRVGQEVSERRIGSLPHGYLRMKFTLVAIHAHARGKIYEVIADGKTVSILLTFHTLERMAKWRLAYRAILQTLLFPEEVFRGHRGRFIAHRRAKGHVVRAIYEYEGSMPVVITVYNPSAKRYFQGGGTYEDHILA